MFGNTLLTKALSFYHDHIEKNKKIFVGLSGGVDSAVSLALLKEAGFSVVGVFIKTWHPDFLPCTWRDERRWAMRVAAKLNVPFLTLDLEKEYKDKVADYMITEYRNGRTPNPDVLCNKEIKFGSFLEYARNNEAFVATGHYAQLGIRNGTVSILKGIDESKDQSYFLWGVSKDFLSEMIFPIGHLMKSEVRQLARYFGLPNSEKKDSQGVCFLGDVDLKEFLSHYIDLQEGEVLSQEGEVIGMHAGSILYTIGQRHGFTILHKSYQSQPLFVISKNLEKNQITVSAKIESTDVQKASQKVILNSVNLFSEIEYEKKTYLIQNRYHGPKEHGTLNKNSDIDQLTITFLNQPENISIGQSSVIYDDHYLIGGGIIDSY